MHKAIPLNKDNVQLAREYEEQIKANQPAWLFLAYPVNAHDRYM